MAETENPTELFYARHAQAYAARETGIDRRLDAFLAHLAPDAAVLELGCGGGRDSAHMIAKGFDVTPTDGSAEIARQAEIRLGRPVAVLRFGDIAFRSAFDGVWARACLLHVPRPQLPAVLGLVRAALKPGGVFYASYKAGTDEGHDRFGRYYNYPDAGWLRAAYGLAGWPEPEIDEQEGGGYDGLPTVWLHVTVKKDG